MLLQRIRQHNPDDKYPAHFVVELTRVLFAQPKIAPFLKINIVLLKQNLNRKYCFLIARKQYSAGNGTHYSALRSTHVIANKKLDHLFCLFKTRSDKVGALQIVDLPIYNLFGGNQQCKTSTLDCHLSIYLSAITLSRSNDITTAILCFGERGGLYLREIHHV